MTLIEAIEARHSVRKYVSKPLSAEMVSTLQAKIEECNTLGDLNIQLVTNETRAFSGPMAYGTFKGVENYFVMVGKKSDTLDERIGYYGEQLVLLAQQLGLNTCWAGISYRKVNGVYQVKDDEKLACMISLGYGVPNVYHRHGIKTVEQVSNATDATPQWFRHGVEAALRAPTAINQQKFFLEYVRPGDDNIHRVRCKRFFSVVGYTQMDMGIAKFHFEIGAGKDNFEWLD